MSGDNNLLGAGLVLYLIGRFIQVLRGYRSIRFEAPDWVKLLFLVLPTSDLELHGCLIQAIGLYFAALHALQQMGVIGRGQVPTFLTVGCATGAVIFFVLWWFLTTSRERRGRAWRRRRARKKQEK